MLLTPAEPNTIAIAAPPASLDVAQQHDAQVPERVLSFLRLQGKPTPTLDIARAVFGPDARAKTINPHLHRKPLFDQLVKSATKPNGGGPQWSLKTI